MTNNFETLGVNFSNHTYKILVGAGLLEDTSIYIEPLLSRRKIAVITDENIARLHLEKLKNNFMHASIEVDYLIVPCGEQTKDWFNLSKIVEWLIKNNIERDDVILAFGGGVIGDLVGFAASIVRRGVSVIQVPTTLLSQVDSSVGGKTGINSISGKNLIGTFHQPSLVIADIDLLETLSPRQFLSGYSEVIKYGLLGDRKFFDWLETNTAGLLKGHASCIKYAVMKSCMTKIKVVTADEKEKGQRALLNLGHTFGHALEAATNYSDKLLHGEGVSIGCILAFKLSNELGFCSDTEVARVIKHFKSFGLKTQFSDVQMSLPNADGFIELMMHDKKVKNGVLNLILVNQIGSAFISEDVPLKVLHSFLCNEMS